MVTSASTQAWLQKLTLLLDPYDRQARLMPAIWCLSPAAVMLICLYTPQLTSLTGLGAFAAAAGLAYLLSDIARSKGKVHEQRLWLNWGGSPSIQVLRHRDSAFDSVSKRRYHALLATKLKVPFPSAEAEATDPDAADDVYAAAGVWLREATRDRKKFQMLFQNNIAYGRSRNAFGLRRIGLVFAVLTICWVVLRNGLTHWPGRLASAATPEAVLSAGEAVTIIFAAIMLLLWLFFFTEAHVREAAFSYAKRLILSCESLPKTRAAASRNGATTPDSV